MVALMKEHNVNAGVKKQGKNELTLNGHVKWYPIVQVSAITPVQWLILELEKPAPKQEYQDASQP